MIQILELFGGIGSPRVALRNLGIPVKTIDYVEIDKKAVNSYNAMFYNDMTYKPQNVIGYNLKPDILIHGSPCQSFSICGKLEGADKGSGTESSLMWETINIIKQMTVWRPKVVIWENVKNVLSKRMKHNFSDYLCEMKKLGYTNNYKILNAMEFGLPQNRNRVFTISYLKNKIFNFDTLEKKPMKNIKNFLQNENEITKDYIVTQPSILRGLGQKGIKRTTIIKDFCYTITERQDRCPAQVLPFKRNKYRYLTDKECWLLQGYSEQDYHRASKVNSKRTLYKQAGNSMPVPVLESIYKQILNI